jgi:DNA sulfur modification protein DndE
MKANWKKHAPLTLAAAVAAVALVTAVKAQTATIQAKAEITVLVPANAEVFFDGEPTTQRGVERLYLSPPLEVGRKYSYEVLARWQENGKPVEQTRKVEVSGGARVRVDFLALSSGGQGSPSEEEAFKLGTEAYIYGYPLVTMEMTRRVLTNVPAPKGTKAPMGQFANLREYPTAAFKDVTAPNADTLYSVAWLDLVKEPWVLHVPAEDGRYYLMPMLSAWTNVFADPGKRTTGTEAGDYAIIGPGWNGPLPEGVKRLKSPTNMVWVLGRTYCTGTPEDYKAVHAIQDQYALRPLSAWGKPYTPPANVPVDPAVAVNTPPREQVNKMDAGTYFKLMARLMKDNPPAEADAPMVAKLAKLAIVPGREFDLGKVDPAVARGLQRAVKAGLDQIVAKTTDVGKKVNGWDIAFTGDYGTDYLFRSAVAFVGLGANRPQDACYPMTGVDAEGKPLGGANRYVLHFASKNDLPPTNGFWSLTMYNADYFFVANPLNRYTLSQRNQLQENTDGSIDLYLQKDSPGKDKESNWLPAPDGRFNLCLRLYWPKESFLDGFWMPPPVKRVP